MKEFGELFLRVGFIHFCGIGLLMIPFIMSAFLFQMEWVESYQGMFFSSYAGILFVAVSIRGGEFIDDVKDSHWSKRKNEQ